jgi:putative aldouronate transport system permease protein
MISHRRFSVFDAVIYLVIAIAVLLCLAPFLYVLSLSLSSSRAVMSREVFLWPVEFDLLSYKHVLADSSMITSLWMSVRTTVLFTCVTMPMTILAAYPLSQKRLKGRRVFLMLVLVTMYFSGGLIPDYILVSNLGLTNSIWGLVLPGCINTFNLIILRTFFSNSIPDGIIEAAQVDGSNDLRTLVSIVLPLSLPVLATLALFYAVGRWNGFQDAKFYINRIDMYTLPQKINMVINSSQLTSEAALNNPELASDRTTSEGIKAASIIFTTLPILIVYPFLQKYFISGVMIGSIKE